MKEYSRYMKSIGEKETPIQKKSFNFYGIDVTLDRLDESAFKHMQDMGVTDSILEDVVRITLHHLWKSQYVHARDIEITKFDYNDISETYSIECIGSTKMCCVSYDQVKILSENIDIQHSTNKPKLQYEEYKPMTTVVENKVVPLDSFSRFYDSLGEADV